MVGIIIKTEKNNVIKIEPQEDGDFILEVKHWDGTTISIDFTKKRFGRIK
jgi:hypothetical protein